MAPAASIFQAHPVLLRPTFCGLPVAAGIHPPFSVRAPRLQLEMTKGDFVPSQQPPEQEQRKAGEHTTGSGEVSQFCAGWSTPETQARQARAPAGDPAFL